MRRACARLTPVDFATFALSHLPPPPARVLEVGCGSRGGITSALAEAGYDVLAIDPEQPEGEHYRAITLEQLEEQPFDAVVAERVFHHVQPLGEALDKVARMAPLFLLDEFAWERMDEPTRDWYQAQHRRLVAAGREPFGPPDLAAWQSEHDDLHPSDVLLRELRARFEERFYEDRPYLYRWLAGPVTESLEEVLVAARAIRPIGYRWIGVSRSPRPAARARSTTRVDF
jgi:Methyltransferase domain